MTLPEVLPYMPLENFKRAWNHYCADKHNSELVDALEQAWQMLQKVAKGKHTGVGKGEPAWPGPIADVDGLLVNHIEVTAKWLAKHVPNFEEKMKFVSDPPSGM